MEVFLLLVLAAVTHAEKHSLKHLYSVSSGLSSLPEFVAVGLIDEVVVGECDSNTKRAKPKYDWMNKITEDEPTFWEWHTERCIRRTNDFKVLIDSLKQRFNQTGGVHTYQNMYGCEWDDETEEIHGFYQDGYDGKDFLSFDLNTLTWVALTPQAVITKHEWDRNIFKNEYIKKYLTQDCSKWLKKFVGYGKHFLRRKELPSVSLLQKTPSSPVTCLATGFYPDRADLFWTKDGKQLHVDHGEILPNHDGTFQMSVDLNISSIAPEDWKKYECVFQLSGVKDNIITKLDAAVIRTNQRSSLILHIIIPAIFIPAVIFLALTAGFIAYKKRKASWLDRGAATVCGSSCCSAGLNGSGGPVSPQHSDTSTPLRAVDHELDFMLPHSSDSTVQ